jgi:hypothetical protein
MAVKWMKIFKTIKRENNLCFFDVSTKFLIVTNEISII